MKKTEIILILFLFFGCLLIDIYFKTNLSILGLLAMSCFNLIESKRCDLLKDDILKLNGQLADKDREIDELNQNYLFARNQVSSLKLEVDEKYQELSLLCKKHSRTNQPRSGGKFTPIIVKKGDKYMCKKDVDMGAYIAFSSGQLYISEHDRCITNNNNNEWHTIGSEFCKKHFKLIEPCPNKDEKSKRNLMILKIS